MCNSTGRIIISVALGIIYTGWFVRVSKSLRIHLQVWKKSLEGSSFHLPDISPIIPLSHVPVLGHIDPNILLALIMMKYIIKIWYNQIWKINNQTNLNRERKCKRKVSTVNQTLQWSTRIYKSKYINLNLEQLLGKKN